jgi:hypothetical protein
MRLTFPITRVGLTVAVLIGPDDQHMQDLSAAGVPLPAPIHGQALIDTGSDWSALSPAVLAALQIPASGNVSTHTAAGPTNVQSFTVSLTIYDPTGASTDTLFRGRWRVTGLPYQIPNVDVLLGMDLVSELILTVDGPGRQFAFEF